MEPVEFLRLIRRRWQFVAVLVLLGLVAGWVTGSSRSADPRAGSFTATATLSLAGKATGGNRPTAVEGLNLETMAFLATTGDVPKRVADKIAFEGSPALLASRVKATPDKKLNTISLRASGVDGPRAAEIANTFAAELIASLDERAANQRTEALKQLNDRQQQLRERIAALDAAVADQPDDSGAKAQRDASIRESTDVFSRISDLNAKGPPVSGLTLLQEAVPVTVAEKNTALPQSRTPRMIIAAVLAMLASVGGLLLWDRFDTRVRTKADAEAMFGFPVVAEIPAPTRRGHTTGTGAAAAYRLVRASLILRPLASAPASVPGPDGLGNGQQASREAGVGLSGSVKGWKCVVLVTAADPTEEKSASIAGLAAAFAEIGKWVLVLSWDFDDPAIDRRLGAEEGLGLRDVLNDREGHVKLLDLIRRTTIAQVGLVTTGSRTVDPAGLFGRAGAVLARARELADVVIVDTGPILSSSEALELMPAVDAVLLVSKVGRTSIDSARQASELLVRFAAPVHGVVLVGTDPGRHRRVDASGDRVAPEGDSPLRQLLGRIPGRRGTGTAGPAESADEVFRSPSAEIGARHPPPGAETTR